jgi:hypothetical protein
MSVEKLSLVSSARSLVKTNLNLLLLCLAEYEVAVFMVWWLMLSAWSIVNGLLLFMCYPVL